MIIAIDGTAGSGKSTLASRLAQQLGFVNLNSGNIYRAVSYMLSDAGVDFHNESESSVYADSLEILYNKDSSVTVGGLLLTDSQLHSPAVDEITNITASYRKIREKVNSVLNSFADSNDVVCEGRDICSVVFPDADFRFYIDASIEIRAKRRSVQFGLDYAEVYEALKRRDYGDKNRPFGALVHTKGEIYIDTDEMSDDEVYKKVFDVVTRGLR